MIIKIKSNMAFVYKMFIPLAAVGFVACVMAAIALAVDYEEQKDAVPYMILLGVFTVVLIVILVAIRLYNGRRYEFTENEIVCYKKNTLLERIDVSNIDKIRFGSVSSLFFGAPIEGGLWKLHISLKDGSKKSLAFFSKKNVKELKEKLYGDLIVIE